MRVVENVCFDSNGPGMKLAIIGQHSADLMVLIELLSPVS